MDIGLAVGGAFLSSALNVLFDRLAPHGELLRMFQKNKHYVRLLKKLKMTLVGLQAVLSDAENKQASNRHVSQWLNELRDAVDGAENLMEQVNYEALSLSDDFFVNIKEKLEDTIETLEDLQKQIGLLGLKEHFASTKRETRRHSTSLVDEFDVFGRQNEKEELIDRLLSKDASEKSPTVVPIVGMGGVGKTTLAKAAYNDENVKSYFNLKAWFCVSEPYDAIRITKGLLQEIGSFDLKDDNNLNQLQAKLKESLKGKRFLIVLDDMWNDDYNEWNDLRTPFVPGDMGSKIIVTTRKKDVAGMMGSGAVNVGTLSREASWALFKRHSLENRDPLKEHPELEEVGKQISDKCKGLPLALKTLAGFLCSKSEEDEWTDVLRSEIWELSRRPNGILPALMLSYNDLPAHLKQCFAFCDCYSLPALGQLPSLKFLSIREMHRITEVMEEFYGSPSSEKPFNSLEKLEFAEMPEWKQWHVLGNGEFPALQYLSIDDCPKLVGKFPENLCSLMKLRITRYPELFTSQLEGMKQIEELFISNCNSHNSMPISTLPSTLKTIWIFHCRKLKLEAPDSSRMNSNMLLEELRLDECDSISSSPELVPRARTLRVWKCQNLTRFFIPNGTETLHIWGCENLEILLSVACGTHMTSLGIFDCKKLKRLPEGMQELLPSLKILRLQHCPEIESFPDGGLPLNFQVLEIDDCEKLVNSRKEWRLQTPLSPRSLLEEGLPSSVSELYLYDHDELHALPTEGLRHLTSLQSLHISNCNQLQSLPESALPSSLSELNIWNCRNIQSLPVKGMTSSLSELSISCCPLLKPLLEFDKGEYWPEIAHISTIEIDDEYL
ncbi:hypothetical protein P3S68_002407 [Capsicum galapagoense]